MAKRQANDPVRDRARAFLHRAHWQAFTMLTLSYTRGPRILGLVVDPTSCAVLAFEGVAPVFGEPIASGIAAFFGDHAHKLVHDGQGITFADAVRLAEEYGKKWKAEGTTHDRCECSELGAEVEHA